VDILYTIIEQPPSEPVKALSNDNTSLQLGLGLGLLQDRVQLGGLHDVALDLELSAHEKALRVGLAGDQAREVVFAENKSDYKSNPS
jgi:hypothetical protein